jgi:hypothetical protein
MSVTEAPTGVSGRDWLRSHAVLVTAGAMILVQLAFRAWATYGSWYHYDDFNFMARMAGAGLSPSAAIEPYIGHVMPAGMYLSWLADAVAPYDFRVTATLLLVMQAGAAGALLWMLVQMFGVRPGILPPLAFYLFCVITTPVAIWWAAGVNQLPWHIALFAGLGTHATYLRTRQLRYVLMTVGWSVFGLAFYEKTVLLFAAIAFVSLAYFASGTLGVRAVTVLRTYARGVAVYAGVLGAYLLGYVAFALDFAPGAAVNDGLDQVVWNMVGRGYVPALAGGPVRWEFLDQAALPDPGSAVRWAAVAVVALVVWEVRRARTRSLRAWLLPAAFLAVNALLVLAGRATYLGTQVSLDYRYQGELGAVTALALALAVLPLRGAVEPVEHRQPSELLDHPRRVALVVVTTIAVAAVSNTGFVRHWQTHDPAQAYFDNLLGALRADPTRVVLDDTTVPVVVMGAYSYPDNTLSHLLTSYSDETSFPRAAVDRVSTVTDSGEVVPTVVTPLEKADPGPQSQCGYRIEDRPRTITLVPTGIDVLPDTRQHSAVWVRIGYLASGPSPVTVRVGDETIRATIVGGLHALYLRTGLVADTVTRERVSQVTVSGLQGGAALCTNDLTAGPLAPITSGAQDAS